MIILYLFGIILVNKWYDVSPVFLIHQKFHFQPKSYNITTLRDDRLIIHNFVSEKEANDVIKLIQFTLPSFNKQYEGHYSYAFGHLPPKITSFSQSKSSYTESINGTSSERMLNVHHGRSKHHHHHHQTTKYLDLFKNYMRVILKIADFVEAHVKEPLLLESCLLAVRQLPGERIHIPFRRYQNSSHWTHGIHADQCHLHFAFPDRFECTRSKFFNVNRHFTAVLYLHEVEGGNFAFIDLPRNHLYRSLTDIPAPSNTYVARRLAQQKKQQRQSRRLDGSEPGDEFYLTKYGIYTIIAPSVGQMSLFSSGAENIHGVTELRGGVGAVRYSLNVWFTKASNVSEQPTE